MEAKVEGGKKVRRIFTPEQKFEILKDIERCRTIKEGFDNTNWRNRCITSGSGSWKWESAPC
jgi:hypothetical protein